MLEGVSAGTALMGHKAVSITVMAGTHNQLTQAGHRPAKKQHMCRKIHARLLFQHLFDASKVQMLGNAEAFVPIKDQAFIAQYFLSDLI